MFDRFEMIEASPCSIEQQALNHAREWRTAARSSFEAFGATPAMRWLPCRSRAYRGTSVGDVMIVCSVFATAKVPISFVVVR